MYTDVYFTARRNLLSHVTQKELKISCSKQTQSVFATPSPSPRSSIIERANTMRVFRATIRIRAIIERRFISGGRGVAAVQMRSICRGQMCGKSSEPAGRPGFSLSRETMVPRARAEARLSSVALETREEP